MPLVDISNFLYNIRSDLVEQTRPFLKITGRARGRHALREKK
jgi:hypothetical protein